MGARGRRAPGGDVLETYLLLFGVPLLALVVAAVAIVRLHGRRKQVLGFGAPALAPGAVALAWILAGAR